MSFIDLGKKSGGGVETAKPSINKIYYPSFYIDKKTSFITKEDIGNVIEAKVKLKVKSHEERVDENGKETYSCSFDVLGIDFGEKSLDELEKEEYVRNPIKPRRG